MYEDGTGVPQDFPEAVWLYRVAADQGHAKAQCSLALMYMRGIGVPEDFTEAKRFYQLAADQGYANAQHSLGIMYAHGFGGSAGPRR